MASATRSDLSTAKILEFEDAGRGNQDENITVAIAAVPAGFTFEVPTTWTFNSTTSQLNITIPQPSGSDLTIAVVNDRTATGTPTVTVANGTRTGDGAAANMALGINGNSNFSASSSGRVVTVRNASGGLVTTFGNFAISTTSITGLTDAQALTAFTPFDGANASSFEETVFHFTGPFTNINPNKDALQGLSIVARTIDTFLSGYSTSTEAGINGLLDAFKSRLDTAFPASSELPGVSSNVSNQLGKITLLGSKRPPSGLLGRDAKTINNIFVNDAADFGLRQLTLRIYDSLIDTLNFIEESSVFADSQTEVVKLLREFDVDFGELERALGRNSATDTRSEIPYDNTIVNGSGDQGMLVYADQIADIIASLSAATTTDYATFRTAVIAITSKERLLLKN